MTIPVVRFVYLDRAHTESRPRPYTVVYDGTCRVCNRLVRLLERWDRRRQLALVPSQDATVTARFPWIPAEAYARAVQLVGPGGRTWQGAEAIEQLLTLLPSGWMLGWVFRLPLAGRLVDRAYRWFARNRYRFGCGEHCQFRPLALKFGDEVDTPER